MAFFYYAICIVLCIYFTNVKCIGLQSNVAGDLNTAVQKNNRSERNTQECNCGSNSKKCQFRDGEKVCDCEYSYRQIDGFCKPFCKKLYHCKNGAKCVNESCQCLPGTRGDFCDIVDECEGMKGALKCGDPKEINCVYDSKTQKAACTCRTFDYSYDASRRICIECDCNNKYGSCSLVNGVKTCKCNPGAALKKGDRGYSNTFSCSPCECGNNSNSCSYKDLSGGGIYWSKVCDCKDGYYQTDSWDMICEKCECEPHGKCNPRGIYLRCDCDEGYKSFLTKDRSNITCKECDCGGNGKCSFKEEQKICECDKTYAERNGKCIACQCYANDKAVDCYFEGRTQHCLCPEGYENGTFFCKDINECLKTPSVCPDNTICVNTPASFECPCLEGYEPRVEGVDPKVYGCLDIDECEIESMCSRVHTVCTNLPGSYECKCKWGYEPVSPNESPAVAGCQFREIKPVSSPWKTPATIVGVIIFLCIAGIGITMLWKSRSKRQQPGTDTVLERMS